MRIRRIRQYRAALITCLLASLCVPAAAQTYSGLWSAGTTSMKVQVESWGGDCGPRPRSSSSKGGGSVQISEQPPHLVIHSKNNEIRTDRCWSRNPAMKRRSSSYLDGVWRTQCRTDPDDPRAEHGSYTLKANGLNELLYKDVSRYNWKLNESQCVATITTTQTLHRVGGGATNTPRKAAPATAPEPEPPEPPEPEATPDAPACTPGQPATLTLRPRSAEIPVGGRVCFRARVADAAGCVVRKPRIEWSLHHSRALKGSLRGGCFEAADSAAEAEGEFQIVAKLGSLSARAQLEVRSVDLSSLIARRIETGAVSGFDQEQQPAEASSSPAAKVATRSVDDRSSGGAGPWLALGAVLVLAIAGFAIGRAKSRAGTGAATAPPSKPPAERAPAAATEGDRPRTGPASSPAASPAAASTGQEQWICPSCRRGYPADQRTCPNDGTALMPYSEFVKQKQSATEQHPGKRCPKCGRSFPAGSGFCSEDGTRLT